MIVRFSKAYSGVIILAIVLLLGVLYHSTARFTPHVAVRPSETPRPISVGKSGQTGR
jgi:hypothetical protein